MPWEPYHDGQNHDHDMEYRPSRAAKKAVLETHSIRCVDCGLALATGPAERKRPQAMYGPPCDDWLCRCPACYVVTTGYATMAYTPEYPRATKRTYVEEAARRTKIAMDQGDRRDAAWAYHLARQRGDPGVPPYSYERYRLAAFGKAAVVNKKGAA